MDGRSGPGLRRVLLGALGCHARDRLPAVRRLASFRGPGKATFTKLYLAWNRVSRREVLDGYTRRTLVRTFLDERRRGWFRREHVAPPRPGVDSSTARDREGTADGSRRLGPEDRLVLLDALASVPPRQRAVLVLRYWEDLSIEETATVLRCSTGTVKSQAARGLATLRAVLAARDYKEITP